MKREDIEEQATRVAVACILSGSKVSTAFAVAADFARVLEDKPEPTSTRVEEEHECL